MARFVLIAFAVVLGPTTASAQGQLSDGEILRRLDFLEERLDASRTHGRIWFYGWAAVLGGSAIGNTYRAAADDSRDKRSTESVDASKSVIGLADLILRPLEARHGADRIRAMPASSTAERQAKLEAAEAQLETNARRSDRRRAWMPHIGKLTLNVVGGIIIGTAGGDWTDAGMSMRSGFFGGL